MLTCFIFVDLNMGFFLIEKWRFVTPRANDFSQIRPRKNLLSSFHKHISSELARLAEISCTLAPRSRRTAQFLQD